ncbi:50S ribosomal protein L17 [Candidatus Kaiserbacteria bacterium]|nr:50S ribosomal protein L17 [Candidatus Kaiserbacteria bacterium]
MRHSKKGRTFGRKRDVRMAFLCSIAEALISREKILTTEARAKEVRPFVESLITRGKSGTLAARRALIEKLGGREKVAKKVIEVLSPRFKDRSGGYTRITKVVKRSSDGRKSAVIEFVS